MLLVSQVWALLLLSIVAFVVLFTIFPRCYYNWALTFPLARGQEKKTILDTCGYYAIYMTAVFTNQGLL